MKKLVIILLVFTSSLKAQEFKYAVYNTVSSGLIGGVGAGLNKHKGQSFFQAFKKGFVKGCVGGTLNYTSKYMLSWQDSYSDNLNWRVFWSSKIVNSLSNTIIYNAANNNDTWLGHYAINVGSIRFSIDNKIELDAISSILTFYCFASGAKFDFKKSVITGTFIFKNTVRLIEKENVLTPKYYGIALGQNIILSNYAKNKTLTHEIVHTYQRNMFVIHLFKNIKVKHIHNDLSAFDLLYLTSSYKSNVFEKEADYFSGF